MPDPDRSGRPAAAIVAAVRAVPGVTQAELVGVVGDGSAVLRLTLGSAADEVAVSTAVDATLRRQFRLRLDPARIELVEESEPAPTAGGRALWRPVVVGAVVAAGPDEVRCEVVLRRRDVEHHGVAVVAGSSVHRVVVLATLRAVASVLGPGSPARLTVVSLGIHSLDDASIALVRLRLRAGTGSEWLVGACDVRGDPVQALVRATLDAVNRRLAPLIDGR